MSTYKGESPAKKVMRVHYWKKVFELAGKEAETGKHLVLASREAGDVSYLSTVVPERNIIAVDTDPEALSAVSARFPEVLTVCADVFTLPVRPHKDKLRSAYLDLCCPCSEELGNKISLFAARSMAPGGILGVNLLMGRESDKKFKEHILQIERSTALMEVLHEGKARGYLASRDLQELTHFGARCGSAALLSLVQKNFEGASELLEAKHQEYKKVPRIDFRHIAAMETIMTASARYGVFAAPVGTLTYQSSTSSSNGVPMYAVLFRVDRPAARPSPRKAKNLGMRQARDYLDNTQGITHVARTEDEHVRTLALQMGHLTSQQLARVFNVPEGRVRAWRAHETMGKYNEISVAPTTVIRTGRVGERAKIHKRAI